MDSLAVNKVFAAVLVAGIAFLGADLVSDYLVRPRRLEKTAIKVDLPQTAAIGAGAAPVAEDPPVATLLVSADPAKGEAVTKRLCVACHTFNEGGHAGVGPNLYGIVGLPHGHMEGYAYSAAIRGKTGPWTFAALYDWLKNPRAYAPGTKMSFAGLESARTRADVIAYLNRNSARPEPLPAVPAAAAKAAPAAGAPAVNAPGQDAASARGRPVAPTDGQTSQPTPNQNMPGAAAAGAGQPAVSHPAVSPAGQGGPPQPTPDHKAP